ncbi:MAG TPA: DUF3267 domain-containing protein [Anaerolineae bacterium]|nr:DUF3267 domain-containing protein [Anaerolineae bacterium]HQK14993.1 DUF3267 domain-containing protein [Anaerolineae bacterium]
MTTKLVSPIHLPENYEEVLYWKLSHHKTLLVVLNVVGLALMGLALVTFFAWARIWHLETVSLELNIWQMVAALFAVAVTIVLHELTHGLALRAYGAQPKYGVMWQEMMFYATAAGYAFRRNAYIVIALAPLVGLSLVGMGLLMLPIPDWLLLIVVFCAALNVGSAIGDMWLVRVALGYPRVAYVVDEKDGLRMFMPVVKA